MAPPRLTPSDSTLKKWRIEEGLSLNEIVERVRETEGIEVSRNSIASALSRAGLTNRIRYDDVIPWDRIKTEHNKAYQLTMLRLLARRRHSLPLTAAQEEELDRWLTRLESENAVVLYRYDSKYGFYYVKRKEGDPEDIPIRMP